jgi:hypothetical protein
MDCRFGQAHVAVTNNKARASITRALELALSSHMKFGLLLSRQFRTLSWIWIPHCCSWHNYLGDCGPGHTVEEFQQISGW